MEPMPVFVKIDDYHSVLDLMRAVQRKMDEAKETLAKINELKNEEDHQIEMWQSALVEIEKKIEFMNQSLNEPEQI